jgi:hypothetical protein
LELRRGVRHEVATHWSGAASRPVFSLAEWPSTAAQERAEWSEQRESSRIQETGEDKSERSSLSAQIDLVDETVKLSVVNEKAAGLSALARKADTLSSIGLHTGETWRRQA